MPRLNAKQSRLSKDAVVVTPGLIPCGCVIDSVALDSKELRLSLKQLTSPTVLDQLSSSAATQADLHVFLDHDHDKQHIHFRGAVRAGRGNSISLDIAGITPDLKREVDLLVQHTGRSRLAEAAPDPALKQLYHQHCRRLLEQLLPEFMEGTFEGIEADLEQAAELREITRLKDMRFIFQSRQQRMLQDFQAQFQANQATLEPATESRAGSKELHLLQQHEFEDWLDLQAIATGISKANSGATFLLNQFLNQIFRQDVNDDNNPLTPRALCVCLQYMVDHLGIAREHRLTIYRAWESALGRVWPAAIRSLINDCRRAGLEALDISELPANWSLRDHQSEEADSTTGTVKNSSAEPAGTEDIGHATSEMPSAGRSLFQLMALEASPSSELADWEEPNPKLSENLRSRRRELLNRLHDDEPDMAGLLQELADSDSDLASSLDRTAVEKANLVDRLFAPLKTHEELSGSLRHQLQKLRLPVFETLVETPDFLNADDHPARDIINNLMHICLAERASSKKLEATVADIVEELTEIEVSDPELLETLGQRLKQLVERQDQSFIRNSERLAKTLEGKERLRRTRKQARQRVNALLGGRQVPKILIGLLQAGWEQLIVLTMLREGQESRHCEELIDVVAQLQAWLSPAGTSEELAFERELESSVVLQFIERELRTAGDVSRIRPVIDELSEILQGHVEAQTTWVEEYGDDDEAPLTLPPELEDSRWVSRAKDIAVGDWVEVWLDSGETRRMRLVWGGEESLRFVFLSPKGMSEVSYGFPEFVRKLAEGEAWLVEDGDIPFLDQSLFSIVEEVYRKLNFQATHDALTGCMHRHDFEKQVSGLISTAPSSPEDSSSALMVLDIDEFSVINASYGAEAGDTLLKHVADTLRQACESRFSESHVGRISGNEFAVLINNISTEDCLDFAESLRRNFEQQVFQHGPAEYKATVSISIRPVTAAAHSPGDLLNQASLSLKAAKKLGGNRIELARGNRDQSQIGTPQWVTEIDRTIRDGSLYLRAQPIVALAPESGEGKMYELLLGLKDSAGKEISPQGYIEAAEQFKRSTRVDLWVISEVLAWMRDNPEALDKIATLNVNLSGASLSDDSFMLGLESNLRSNPELAHKICFEITETSAVANLHFASDFMREMKRLNCRFALDDFGTGLSSYAYLQKLPVDFVKIDGIFVRDMATNLTNYAMVRSINELCHFLDLKTIAEYVEDMEIMDTLKEIQVDYAQGFAIAKPRRLDHLGNRKTDTPVYAYKK
ncbi:histidine kinase [Marinobacter sp. EhC06]|jgi:diguanylate cyclase (GGDEF)-like protein|uniref:DUF1631 family protein n=1 Tax=Marinobacter TaxID=2742 RepID=UPI0007DA35B5|nr:MULTISPECIES: DUF1631 family protein [unclassified Marinobacter]OAN93771.1 histidine kinase [Marinobacter sp. EhC06]OAN94633.1 histidine kinase [Marinobacter sp. EhN04]